MKFEVRCPILGFDGIHQMELSKIDDFFVKLSSTDGNTSFTLVNPYVLMDYEFEIPSFYQEKLEIKDTSELKIYNIVVLSNPLENSHVNLLAPIVINMDNKTLGQIVLDPTIYKNFHQAEKISKFLNKN